MRVTEVNMQVIKLLCLKGRIRNICSGSESDLWQKFRIHSTAHKNFVKLNKQPFINRDGSLAFGPIDVFFNVYPIQYVNSSSYLAYFSIFFFGGGVFPIDYFKLYLSTG